MARTTIQCQGIKKWYGDKETRIDALRGIDLEIYANQLTLLVGPSGSGKTTLLSIMTTILTPDAGQLILLEKTIAHLKEKEKAIFCRTHLGIVFQSLFLIPTLTVLENVILPLLIGGVSQSKAEVKGKEILKKVNMAQRAHHSPAVLSKGQQQRVAIARAMVNEASIIVCDEPTSALDQTAGLDVMKLLQEIAHDAARTVLVVTHDHRIFSFADRIIHMNDGQITSEDKYV